MSYSVKRAKSKFEQFRMVVPADLREVVGKREWTKSLKTTDPLEAKAERARLTAEHHDLVVRLRAGKVQEGDRRAAALVDQALDRLARARGSMDAAIVQQLALLSTLVSESWDPQALDRRQQWGDFTVLEPELECQPVPSIDDDGGRSIFRLQTRLIEGHGVADGFVHRALAKILLERKVFRPIEYAVSYLRTFEPRLGSVWQHAYDAVAEHYLIRLTTHEFAAWPADIDQALAPITSIASSATSITGSAVTTARPKGLWAKALVDALDYWKEQRRPSSSAITEATRSITRFVALFGNIAVGSITRPDVIEFRNLIADLPPRTELDQVHAAGKTLRSVIEDARQRRKAWSDGDRKEPEPERLAPGTVKKDVGTLSQILSAILDDDANGTNVAERITIADYSKTRKGQKNPRLPLTPAMMQTLFDSPLFTGCAGRSDVKRAQPGPHLFQDELYWPFLFGVVGGPRLGEIGQIALADIHECDLRRTYGSRYDGTCLYVRITGTGQDQSTKNDNSEREVVLHDRLIDLGFREYVDGRRAAGKTTLFDLPIEAGKSRTKALSQRLNRYIDRVVTSDPRYVFHSTRHEFTDRAELSDIPARVANTIKGHAHSSVAENYGQVSKLAQYRNLKKVDLGFIDWDRLVSARTRNKVGR